MRNLVLWFNRLSIWPRLAISSLATAVPFYFAAYLSYSVAETMKQSTSPILLLLFHATIFIIMLTSVIFIFRIFSLYHDQLKKESERIKENLLHSYAICERTISKNIYSINSYDDSKDSFIETFVSSLKNIQHIVNSLYQSLESEFGKEFYNNERIDFEVTFMTKSYIDGYITIPASANKDGRSPNSMLLRKTKADTYVGTVTDIIYNSSRPDPIIIENTEEEKSGYSEVYPGQKKRIKSSIVYPILSDKNELLGTLVAHCDKKNFFMWKNLKIWSDFLEIFSKKIALEKVKMDKLYQGKNKQLVLNVSLVAPF